MISLALYPALRQRLQIDEHPAAVEGGIGAVHPDEGGEAGHGRVFEDFPGQGLLALRHGGKGDGLRRLGDAQDDAGVLHRKEALGHHDIQEHRQDQGGHGHQQRPRLVLEHPAQGVGVEVDDLIVDPLGGAKEPGLLLLRRVLEQPGAHHRGQGQRHHGRDEDGHAQGDGKFPEQPAHHLAHEQHRDQHGDEGDGQGQDGEGDLLRAFEGRLERGIAHFDVAGDVFDHDDGVVHHEAGGDDHSHQGEVVQAEPQEVHHPEGAHQGKRHGHAGNDGGREVAQEQEDHQDHQDHGQHQLELHVIDGAADGGGAVGEHGEVHCRRQGALQLGQQLFDAVDDLDDVGARLPLDVDDHRRGVVHPGRQLDVFGAVDGVGQVGELHRRPVDKGDDQRPVLLAGKELVVGPDDRGLAGAVKAALGLVGVGQGNGRAQVFQGQAIGGQGRGVGLNPHRRPLAAADADQAHARELRDLLGQPGVGQVFDLGQRQGLGSEGQGQDRGIRRIDLAVDRRIGQVSGQEGGRLVDGGLNLLFGHVQADLQAELQDDDRAAAGTVGGHLLQPRHLPELALQGGGHRGGHDVGAGARKEGEHLDGGVIHLGQGRDRQLVVGHGAGQQNGHHQQRGGHRPQDEECGKGSFLGFARRVWPGPGAFQFHLTPLAQPLGAFHHHTVTRCQPFVDGGFISPHWGRASPGAPSRSDPPLPGKRRSPGGCVGWRPWAPPWPPAWCPAAGGH